MGDFYRYQQCDFNFDGDATFDGTADFYENRGTAWDPPHEDRGDRHCYQASSFVATDSEPDAAHFEYIRFSLLPPESFTSGFPLLVVLRGGSIGWSDTTETPVDSWRLDTDTDPFTWDQGRYQGRLDLADGDKDEGVLRSFLADDDGNIVDRLRQEFPGWGILVPSGCSHDLWNGRSDLDDTNLDFENAAQTRYSYAALLEALDFVDTEYGIDYLYVVGGSGGGVGGFILADDLPDDRATLEFRGVVSEAAPFETPAWKDLLDPADVRAVDADDVCADTETQVPCEAASEPFATGFVETGLDGRSASADIEGGTTVPILHMYNKRDSAHYYDPCYSESNLHGEIRRAIDARKAGGFDEDFDASDSVEMCVGSCTGDDGTVLDCTRHTVLGWRDSAPVVSAVDCAVDWVKQVNDYFDGLISSTSLPASCGSIVEDTGSSNAPPCGEQNETLY